MIRGRRRLAPRPGAALLEAIVALAILSIAGIALLRVATEAYHAIELSARSERQMLDAGRLMDAAALWSRNELDQRLGDRQQGAMRMRIVRATPELYHVQLLDPQDEAVLLQTTLHRSRAPDAIR